MIDIYIDLQLICEAVWLWMLRIFCVYKRKIENSWRRRKMEQTYETLGYYKILEELADYANTQQAKEEIKKLRPLLEEGALKKRQRETTQARELMELHGNAPIPLMEQVEEFLEKAVRGELLMPNELEQINQFLVATKRVKSYLEMGRDQENSLAFYCENLVYDEELQNEIQKKIRNGQIDDYASNLLCDIRRKVKTLEEKIKNRAEGILRANKAYTADSFIVNRNGRICVPVKAAYKKKVPGSVIDQSSTGMTLFIEPKVITQLRDDFDLLKIEEDSEERRILYTLLDAIAMREEDMRENIRVIVKLDFIFAKAKMSIEMKGVEPNINLERCIDLKQARHPLLNQEECIPLDFQIGNGINGIVITGPNTGGKTVAIKTVGLLSMMACAGLHVPCESANIALNGEILCDIGDGQSIADNLSTFSSHIQNILGILKRVNHESLVILDELGSGTDPAEGMGIAIAILEQLRQSKCLFVATTHYPEVKEYANRHKELLNARMAFDRESLKPLYRLEIGKAGDSCAFYIAKKLGMPNVMLRMAAEEAYDAISVELEKELGLHEEDEGLHKQKGVRVHKQQRIKKEAVHGKDFSRGDSVMILPEGKIGIVVLPTDRNGNVLVQIKEEKISINHKRLKLQVAANELYPEDYDFSIVFDTVEERKKRHQMERKYQEDMILSVEE